APVVALGPNRDPRVGFDQPGGDPDTLLCSSDAALDEIAAAELASDPGEVRGIAAEDEAGFAAYHENPTNSRQAREDVSCGTVSEVVLLRIAAEVREAQHCNRGPRNLGRNFGSLCRHVRLG